MMIDAIGCPGVFIGALVGVGLAAILQWLFPDADLLMGQALLITVCAVIGLFMELGGKREE